MKIKIHNINQSRKSKTKPQFFLRSSDLTVLALFGFTFFIASFSEEMALSYFLYITIGSLFLMLINYLKEKREDRWPKY